MSTYYDKSNNTIHNYKIGQELWELSQVLVKECKVWQTNVYFLFRICKVTVIYIRSVERKENERCQHNRIESTKEAIHRQSQFSCLHIN